MTAADDIPNILLGPSRSQVTVYTTRIEKIYNKVLVKVNPPQSTVNKGSGPKTTKISDLQRIETRYLVRGYIASADRSNIQDLFNGGGVFNMVWDGDTISINMEKLSFIKAPASGEQDERDITFTAVVGVDL